MSRASARWRRRLRLTVLGIALAGLGAPSARAETSRFVGTNVLSPVPALVPVPFKTLLSVASNLETGAALSAGVILERRHLLELRLAFGPNSDAELIFHGQTYYGFFPMRALSLPLPGLYVGAGLRYWDLYNELTAVHRHNLAGAVAAGYRFEWSRVYLDLRAHGMLAVYSWLSEEHSLGGWSTVADASLPKVPLLSVDFGVRW